MKHFFLTKCFLLFISIIFVFKSFAFVVDDFDFKFDDILNLIEEKPVETKKSEVLEKSDINKNRNKEVKSNSSGVNNFSADNVLKTVDTREKPVAFSPKYIYKDIDFKQNNYIPSGFMGDYGDLKISLRCYIKPCKGKSCMKINYSARESQGNGWAGIYWQSTANNWGTEGTGLNLSGAKRLVFYMKGEKGGEVIEKCKVGGIRGSEFVDTADVDFGPIILKKSWQRYVINLSGYNLSHIIGGFAFVVTTESNPNGVVFYLDEVVFE